MKRITVVYLLVVGIIAWWSSARVDRAPRPQEEPAMKWSEVGKDIEVKAKPQGMWTWAVDYVKGPALILIEASGNWTYSRGASCGPDGDLSAVISTGHAILPAAPIGALLIKIGGSTAGVNDGAVRVAGTKAVIQIDDKTSGPILLTINDEITGFADNDGIVKATVSITRLPAGPAPAEEKPQQ